MCGHVLFRLSFVCAFPFLRLIVEIFRKNSQNRKSFIQLLGIATLELFGLREGVIHYEGIFILVIGILVHRGYFRNELLEEGASIDGTPRVYYILVE